MAVDAIVRIVGEVECISIVVIALAFRMSVITHDAIEGAASVRA